MKRRSLRIACGEEWEDLLQEARLKCLSVMSEPYYQAYLYQTVSHLAMNYLRDKIKMPTVSSDTSPDIMEDLEGRWYETDFGAIYDVNKFMRLHWEQKERDVIYASFTHQATVEDCAEALDIPTMTAHRWLKNVKKMFVEELGAYALT